MTASPGQFVALQAINIIAETFRDKMCLSEMVSFINSRGAAMRFLEMAMLANHIV